MAAPDAACQSHAPGEQAAGAATESVGEMRIAVVCGNLMGVMLLPKQRVVVRMGDTVAEVSPIEFEQMAGKGTNKKWRASIRVTEEGKSEGDAAWSVFAHAHGIVHACMCGFPVECGFVLWVHVQQAIMFACVCSCCGGMWSCDWLVISVLGGLHEGG